MCTIKPAKPSSVEVFNKWVWESKEALARHKIHEFAGIAFHDSTRLAHSVQDNQHVFPRCWVGFKKRAYFGHFLALKGFAFDMRTWVGLCI